MAKQPQVDGVSAQVQPGPAFAKARTAADEQAGSMIKMPLSEGSNPAEFWRQSKGSSRMLRYVSLLYTGFFFIQPYYQHSLRKWGYLALVYPVFLFLYLRIPYEEGVRQKTLIGAMTVLAFVYFPMNGSASGLFVFPIVMLAFCMRNLRTYLLVMVVEIAGICAETVALHIRWWESLTGIFFIVIIGLSNFAYSRQQRAAFLLNRANDEIEHLAQVAERERIARDLHDLLGHTLTVIAIKSELASRLLPANPERAAQEIRDVEQTARKALAEVREAVTGYRSEGIETEVQRARKTLAAAQIQLTTDLQAVELTPARANVLCLVLREAVTNIVRHSGATVCVLTLAGTRESIRMRVEDNGIGTRSAEGNGLRGMRERVEGAGGSLKLASVASGGTALNIYLPTDGALPLGSPRIAASNPLSDDAARQCFAQDGWKRPAPLRGVPVQKARA